MNVFRGFLASLGGKKKEAEGINHVETYKYTIEYHLGKLYLLWR